VTTVTLASIPLPAAGSVHVLALGKGAHPMAAAAVAALRERGAEPAGGVIVSHTDAAAPHPALAVAVGDHPLPGAGSRAAADAVGAAAAAVGPNDLALVLLSGGASSLVGAPVDGVTPAELAALTDLLLGAGEDIGLVNLVRRRVARWGAGRLAVALRGARVECLVLSDVPGYDPALVGSGPCAPDPVPAVEVVRRLRTLGVWERVPADVRGRLERAERGAPDVPPPGDAAFARVRITLLADNATACRAAAEAARRMGFDVELHDARLGGEARTLGAAIGAQLRQEAEAPPLGTGFGTAHVWGGEPAVTLTDAPSDARGGRMQELALAVARAIRGTRVTLLAAGTDGRDGPTDAAGAIVDGDTWDRIRAAGRDPEADLLAHRSHAALDAADALVRTGPTGTNVADVVLGFVAPEPGSAAEPRSSSIG
jgi:glycerate-2-kinase